MRIKNIKQGFTLAEIFIVLIVIGMLTVITIGYTVNSSKMKNKKLHLASKTFYSNISTIYSDVLTNYTKSYNLANLEGTTGDQKEDNKVLAQVFGNYLNGDILDNCDELKVQEGQTVSEYKTDDLVCARFNTGLIAGFNYNYKCETTSTDELVIVDYFQPKLDDEEEEIEKSTPNTCGYIIYGFTWGDGVLGQDLFTIALGKRWVK